VGAGLDCGLGCTPFLSVTHIADAVAVSGLWRYISVIPLLYHCLLSGDFHVELLTNFLKHKHLGLNNNKTTIYKAQ